MVARRALFIVVAAMYVVAGLGLLVFPTSDRLHGGGIADNVAFVRDLNTFVTPRWAGQLISLSLVLVYATTFPSLQCRAKVARGALCTLLGDTLSSGDLYWALLTVWCFVECFAAKQDGAQPTEPGAKRSNKQPSTAAPLNKFYFRALSLLWLIKGVLVWSSPSHLSWFGFPSDKYAPFLSGFSTTSIGSLYVASSIVCGYGATFQSVHDQAKLARSFLWYWLVTLGYSVYGEFVAKVRTGVSDELRYAHIGVSLVFVVWSLVVSFSATSDDIRNPAVKTTIKKKE